MSEFRPLSRYEVRPRFDEGVTDNAVMLKCPKCDDTNLHHGVAHQSPPGPEQTIRVGFECEHCGPIPAVLCIEQHKGWTRIYWET